MDTLIKETALSSAMTSEQKANKKVYDSLWCGWSISNANNVCYQVIARHEHHAIVMSHSEHLNIDFDIASSFVDLSEEDAEKMGEVCLYAITKSKEYDDIDKILTVPSSYVSVNFYTGSCLFISNYATDGIERDGVIAISKGSNIVERENFANIMSAYLRECQDFNELIDPLTTAIEPVISNNEVMEDLINQVADFIDYL